MNSSPQAHHISDSASPSESFCGILPIELFLDILHAAIVQNRRDELPWCLSLSLISRTVRASVLPIVYENLFLDTTSRPGHEYTGRNGKEYKHVGLAFLSWLLHNPDAPPRRHIRHLIFRHEGGLSRRELKWARHSAKFEPAEWPIERLTVDHVQFSEHLYRVGLRPRRVSRIRYHQLMRSQFGDGLFVCLSINLWMLLPVRGGHGVHVQFWPARPLEHFYDGVPHPGLRMDYITCDEITPIPADTISGSVTKTITITIQLVEGDYLHQYPDLLLSGIATFMRNVHKGLVILACSADYRIGGQSVTNFIRAAVPTVLSADAVESRVRVSHWGWAPLSGDRQFRALAREMRCGRDPFDGGHGVPVDSE